MPLFYKIARCLLFAILIFCIAEARSQNQPSGKDAYMGLRNLAFSLTPDKLNLKLSSDKTTVFGVVMEWQMDNTTISLVCFSTGDASLYFSNGGGVVGGGQHENVSNASKKFVAEAQDHLPKASFSESQSLPGKNNVQFYLLTNKGRFVAEAPLVQAESKSSHWNSLFMSGQKVIAELRIMSEKKQ